MPIYKVPPRANTQYSFPPIPPQKALPQSKPPKELPLPPPPETDEPVCASISTTFPPPPDFSSRQSRRESQSPAPASSNNLQVPPHLWRPSHPVKPKRSFKLPSDLEQEQYERQVMNPPARRHSISSTNPHRESRIYEELPELRFPKRPDFSDTRNLFAKPGPMDPYVGSPNVVGLISETFRVFLGDVDAALVLFYDPCEEACGWAKLGLQKVSPGSISEDVVRRLPGVIVSLFNVLLVPSVLSLWFSGHQHCFPVV